MFVVSKVTNIRFKFVFYYSVAIINTWTNLYVCTGMLYKWGLRYELMQNHEQRDGENIISLKTILDQCSYCKLCLSLPPRNNPGKEIES